ncbi:MAG: hypothetical protein AAFV25_22630 [Bacteroidota bacterium]
MMSLDKILLIPVCASLILLGWWWNEPRGDAAQDGFCKASVDAALVVPPIATNDWSYPNHVVLHPDGHFENTVGDTIAAMDTVHLWHNSHCYLFKGVDTLERLPFAQAKRQAAGIQIDLGGAGLGNGISLRVELDKQLYFKPQYLISYLFPYDSLEIKNLFCQLEINRASHQVGDTLVGRLDMRFEQTIYRNQRAGQPFQREIRGVFFAPVQ